MSTDKKPDPLTKEGKKLKIEMKESHKKIFIQFNDSNLKIIWYEVIWARLPFSTIRQGYNVKNQVS